MLKLEQLNDAQRRAVMHGEGPLLVLAGPGSGKTFTITQRILYLIKEMQVRPEEILVITFTKEAALSMQRRFQEQSDILYPVNFGTFHSVFYHILNQSASSRHRAILRESQKKNLLYPIISNVKKEAAQAIAEDISILLSAISFYKNTGNMEAAGGKLPLEWKASFQTVYKAYERARKQENAIDFDDMVYECAELLKKDAQVRSCWQSRFSHILMDEFQDISPMQYRVVKLLSRKPYNLFAVGDDDQAIYGFRGASPACLMQFVKEYQAKQVLLNVNYRCHEEIIRASSLVIEENRERFAKKLVAAQAENAGMDESRVIIHTFTEREEQYQYLVQLFSQKKDKDTCAVLFRTNYLMQSFAAKLRSQGVAFAMKERVASIYEHKAVKDIMAYLRLAAGENKRELWLQVMNKPSRYISREALAVGEGVTIADIKDYYNRQTPDSASYLYVDKIRGALRILEKQLQYLQNASPFLAVQYVRRVVGYDAYVKEYFQPEWLELLDWLTEDAKGYATLAEWLDAQKQYGEMLAKAPAEADRKALAEGEALTKKEDTQLQLMTVHASKGLEFDHVWLADCNEKVFPHGSMPDRETCEEERRIFYVGMTRARKSLELLCLTGTKERPRLPSRFLNPLWKYYSSSSTTSSNSHWSRYSSKASSTRSYSSSSSI